MNMQTDFLKRCSNTLNVIKSRKLDSIKFGYERELDYLKARGLINKNGGNYTISDIGENWLSTFRFDEMINDIERSQKLLAATEESAKAAKDSADAAGRSANSAEEANKIAMIANDNSSTSIKIAIIGVLIALIGLIKSFC